MFFLLNYFFLMQKIRNVVLFSFCLLERFTTIKNERQHTLRCFPFTNIALNTRLELIFF